MDDKKALHFKYWICILVGIIIAMLAVAWAGDSKIAEQIGLAVGLASLALAGVAIYASINFNSLFSSNVNTLLGINQRIEESADHLIKATDDLNLKLETIPAGFKDLTSQVQAMSEKVLARVATTQKQETLSAAVPKAFLLQWTPEELGPFYVSLQYLAIVVVYLFVAAHRNSRRLPFPRVLTIHSAIHSSYMIAVVGFLRSLGLVDAQMRDDAYIVSAVNPILDANIDNWINDEIVRLGQVKLEMAKQIIEQGKNRVDLLIKSFPPAAAAANNAPSDSSKN